MTAFGADRFEEGNKWRKEVDSKLFRMTDLAGAPKRPTTINPNNHFSFLDNSTYKTQREIKDFDIYKATHSDLIIVNFLVNDSIGTSKEIAICHDKGIPVIGLNEQKLKLHPWDIDDCNRIFDDMDEMLEYVIKHYLMD
ncbi:hypothetical protein AALB39_03870 [Lachnospiraceae bacterium 54-53]